jgi:endonuclease/exonuclease/phosphatase family metal-dependent hydrolase
MLSNDRYLTHMRLATFNLLHGRSTRDGLVDLDRLATAVRALDADILALQEVDRGQPRSHLADLTAVAAEAMGAVTHRFAAALSGTPGATWMAATEDDMPGTAAYGIALLSRYPAHSWHVTRLPRIPFRFPLYLRGPRKVVVVDEEPRAAVIGHLDTPVGPLTVANTHLSFVPGWGQWQLRRILRDLASVKGPVVLMGDLNTHNPLPALATGYRSLARHLTFPVETPDRQLDHILLRGQLGKVSGSSAPELPLSDHRALSVDLSLSDQEDHL